METATQQRVLLKLVRGGDLFCVYVLAIGSVISHSDLLVKPSPKMSAVKVVDLQQRLPRARIVYCSATAVTDPKNLGFMSRLGLWGPGTEHTNFNSWLDTINDIGTGAVELNALHLKSIGALQARQLSYATCDFELISIESDEGHSQVHEKAASLWMKLYAEIKKGDTSPKMADFWSGKDFSYGLKCCAQDSPTSTSFLITHHTFHRTPSFLSGHGNCSQS